MRFGSRIEVIQCVAEEIFLWCMNNQKICWTVWLPRTNPIIKIADARSRLSIPHDQRSPQALVNACNRLALRIWGLPLTFDQAASHLSTITVNGSPLPFNSFYLQPRCSGVDMFTQWESWARNINYVYPPRPLVGRLLSFLHKTKSRSIVVMPTEHTHGWWAHTLQRGAPGLVASFTLRHFSAFAFNFT